MLPSGCETISRRSPTAARARDSATRPTLRPAHRAAPRGEQRAQRLGVGVDEAMHQLEQSAARGQSVRASSSSIARAARFTHLNESSPARHGSSAIVRAPSFVDRGDASRRPARRGRVRAHHRVQHASGAASSPSTSANADGPPPEIEQPSAPASSAAALLRRIRAAAARAPARRCGRRSRRASSEDRRCRTRRPSRRPPPLERAPSRDRPNRGESDGRVVS